MKDIQRNTILDLTKPLDPSFRPFSSGKYSDPPLEMADWSAIAQEGFRVSRLSMGTQSGTHLDAPAHFLEGGATLESLLPDQLIGSYFLLDLSPHPESTPIKKRLEAYRQENILFLRTPANLTSQLSRNDLQTILSLPPVLLILSGDIGIESHGPYTFHRLAAQAGKFVAEDLDQQAARFVPAYGEIFALPLRLTGVSGSPCRVIVRYPAVT
ncbi:MAG: cyclase family protein [Smithellaceae bacterium]